MLLARSGLVYGSCSPTACASAPRFVTVFDLCITVAGTRLHTVRVVLEKVVDAIVEIHEGLPVVTSVPVLLVQILVCSESGCQAFSRIIFNSLSSG
jgi:hypothetical protein